MQHNRSSLVWTILAWLILLVGSWLAVQHAPGQKGCSQDEPSVKN